MRISDFFINDGIYFDDINEENAIELYDGKIGFFSKNCFIRITQTPERMESLKNILNDWYDYAKGKNSFKNILNNRSNYTKSNTHNEDYIRSKNDNNNRKRFISNQDKYNKLDK